VTNSLTEASYHQRITHFTEELSFLSESDKGLGHGTRDPFSPEMVLTAASRRRRRLGYFRIAAFGA
jgi:hypothetical protein